MIEVIEAGPLATVQDQGRQAWRHLGVGGGGAMDAEALALANRLVGNPSGSAGIEVTLGGLVLLCRDATVLALTGAPCAVAVDGGPAVAMDAPAAVPPGARVALGAPTAGLRTYVAVRGGIDVAPVLGSRSFDTLGRIGPAPLATGDVLPVGPDPATPIEVDVAPGRPAAGPVRLWPGPREDRCIDALDALVSTTWQVRPESDRIGVRLGGPPLRRARDGELPSEGLVTGAVQIPHDGRPIVMMADHPVTGGYPVVAVVDRGDLRILAQARPGDRIRFVRADRRVHV